MVDLVFRSSEKSGVKSNMQMYANSEGEIFFHVYDDDNDYNSSIICLDLNTAIKFSKELRKEIALIKGGQNG